MTGALIDVHCNACGECEVFPEENVPPRFRCKKCQKKYEKGQHIYTEITE